MAHATRDSIKRMLVEALGMRRRSARGGEEEDGERERDGGESSTVGGGGDAQDEDGGEDEDVEGTRVQRRRRRNRVSLMPSDGSGAEDSDNDSNGSANEQIHAQAMLDDPNDWSFDPVDDADRDDDSPAGVDSADEDSSAIEEDPVSDFGVVDDDQWGVLENDEGLPHFRHFGNNMQTPQYGGGAGGGVLRNRRISVVDLQNTQDEAVITTYDEQREIDLTTLSSDSEREAVNAGEGDQEDDDEVEIVRISGPEPSPDTVRAPRRKRRRRNPAETDEGLQSFSVDTTSAESTNVSLENNEVIEKFKKSLKCSVCLDVIEDMTSTICGHVYCAKCIKLAIRATQKCPLCQRHLRPTDIHGLFF